MIDDIPFFVNEFCNSDDDSLTGTVDCISASVLQVILILGVIASPFVAIWTFFFAPPYTYQVVGFYAAMAFVGLIAVAIVVHWIARLVEIVRAVAVDEPDEPKS